MPFWQNVARKTVGAERKTRPVNKGLEFGTLRSAGDVERGIKSAGKYPVAAAKRDTLMNTLTRMNQQTRKKRRMGQTSRKLRRGTRESTTIYGPRKESYGRRASLRKARKSYSKSMGGSSYARK